MSTVTSYSVTVFAPGDTGTRLVVEGIVSPCDIEAQEIAKDVVQDLAAMPRHAWRTQVRATHEITDLHV